ncbi:PAS domain-containing protein [Rhizobium sp. XQZ8]|uniref:PAS domain-containing protein n=1 Tax=Rhizobium populisoli TaxID=2859785 RepID=UPI001C668F80|nr:PAS domain-containing protein [Rhizobium populisoli]MBW6420633.1 PAS domain-containing protein [Rhizobium populisoli]
MTDARVLDGDIGVQNIALIGFYSWSVPENRVHGDEVIADIFGISVKELALGAPIEVVIRYVDDGDKQMLAKAVHHAIITGEQFQCDYRLTHPNGRKIHIHAIGRCLRDADGVPSIYSGTCTIMPQEAGDVSRDPLESHCRAALGIATKRRHALAARYLTSALNVLGQNTRR